MAVSFINAGAAAGTTVTIPSGHQAGDLLLMWAFDATATTIATVPSGWTSLGSGTGTLCAGLIGWRVAGSSAETSGTWTSATHLVCNVYRGQATNKTPVSTPSQQTGTGTSVSYSGVAPMKAPGTSWLAFFAGISTSDTALESPPTGTTNRADVASSGEVASFDTNGAVFTYTFNSVAAGGTSGNWITRPVEIFAEMKLLRNSGLRPHPFSPGLAR